MPGYNVYNSIFEGMEHSFANLMAWQDCGEMGASKLNATQLHDLLKMFN